jgi:hypothetical protein
MSHAGEKLHRRPCDLAGVECFPLSQAWKMICEAAKLGRCPIEPFEADQYVRGADKVWRCTLPPDIDVVLALADDEPTPPPAVTEATPELSRWLRRRAFLRDAVLDLHPLWRRDDLERDQAPAPSQLLSVDWQSFVVELGEGEARAWVMDGAPAWMGTRGLLLLRADVVREICARLGEKYAKEG